MIVITFQGGLRNVILPLLGIKVSTISIMSHNQLDNCAMLKAMHQLADSCQFIGPCVCTSRDFLVSSYAIDSGSGVQFNLRLPGARAGHTGAGQCQQRAAGLLGKLEEKPCNCRSPIRCAQLPVTKLNAELG